MKISIRNITKQYEGHKALDNVSLEIPSGSIFGLLGPNGAGKTSLIRIITQITAADEGAVYFDDQILKSDFTHHVGYLPEERGLYKKMKVREQLVYISKLKGVDPRAVDEKTDRWLDRFDLTEWANKSVEDLSKGMQQKIQFIATVINEPRILILDEPFSGFDPINANLIKDEILALNKSGVTIIFSTHRMESVEELCTHIGLINHSKVIKTGLLADVKNEFRTNTFIVRGIGDLKLSGNYELHYEEQGIRIKLPEVKTSSDLIKDISMQNFELDYFSELVPSVNDIFLKLVNK